MVGSRLSTADLSSHGRDLSSGQTAHQRQTHRWKGTSPPISRCVTGGRPHAGAHRCPIVVRHRGPTSRTSAHGPTERVVMDRPGQSPPEQVHGEDRQCWGLRGVTAVRATCVTLPDAVAAWASATTGPGEETPATWVDAVAVAVQRSAAASSVAWLSPASSTVLPLTRIRRLPGSPASSA
jgi:hypothetical protein